MILLVASDVSKLLYAGHDLDSLIDMYQEIVGPDGTLLFPTYNMDYCDGAEFDIHKTPSQTGSLSAAALKRPDFMRTQHYIYSFAVWGKQKDWFVNQRPDYQYNCFAPIDFMLLIDVDYQHSFTYAHFVESVYKAKYRYEKTFQDTSLYVRRLEDGVESDLNTVGQLLEDEGAAGLKEIHGIQHTIICLDSAAHIIKKDILFNNGRNLHKDKYTEIETLFDKLFPIMRSITGDGVRETHRLLSEITPLETIEIPSGTAVFDWTVPDEWYFKEAWIKDRAGHTIIDASENNLHIVSGSLPHCVYEPAEILQKHLHSIPEQPTVIPYKTAYYEKDWGFCISDYQKQKMTDGTYQVFIDAGYKKGSLTMSHILIPGELDDEIMFSTYTCHPSMANNELSGPLALIFLARLLRSAPRRYSYRIVFVPETIGSITYMATQDMTKVKGGYEVTCCGVDKPFVYKRSNLWSMFNDVAEYVLESEVRDFYPHRGADERHWYKPMGTIMTCPPGEYPEYHTSLDNKDFISFRAIQRTIDKLYEICQTWEMNKYYRPVKMNGEPCFSKRGIDCNLDAARWLLNDDSDLLYLSEVSGISIDELHKTAEYLVDKGLLHGK